MIAKLKIKSVHPALDVLLEKYKLSMRLLFAAQHAGTENLYRIEYDSSTNAGHELKDCPDVEEMFVQRETPSSLL
jgi:hypothetical protein